MSCCARRLSLGCVALAAFAMIASPAGAADRCVMTEMFTATWCVYCPPVGNACGAMMDSSPSRFAFVQIHNQDAYQTTWGLARQNAYGVPGYPTTWMNGAVQRVGQYPASVYQADYSSQVLQTTDVRMELGASGINNDTYDVTVRVGIEPSGVAKTMQLNIIQVLDHYPAGSTHYRNCFMQAATPQTITVQPGQRVTVNRQFTFSAASLAQQADIKLIAWVQQAPPQRYIYQSISVSRANFRLLGAYGDLDCDGSVTNFDIDAFIMALSDPVGFSGTYPACNRMMGDMNVDGHVNNFDVDAFVAALGT